MVIGHESEALMNGVRDFTELSQTFHRRGHGKKVPPVTQEASPHQTESAGTFILDFQT